MTPALVLMALNYQPRIETPRPKPVAIHRYWDRANKIEFTAGMTLAAADMTQTCHNLAHGGHEEFLPTQNCGQAVAYTVGAYAAAEGVAYILHRTGHHKLERVPVGYMAAASARGIAFSKIHGAW
jgi:hypothetical protein